MENACTTKSQWVSIFPTILKGQKCPQVLTLLTLSEARGGGVSVRSLIISTSETYCKFMSKMSAWLGFPLEEGHSGEKIKLRKTGVWRIQLTQGWCKRCAPSKREGSLTRTTALPRKSLPVTIHLLRTPEPKALKLFKVKYYPRLETSKRACHLSTGCTEA